MLSSVIAKIKKEYWLRIKKKSIYEYKQQVWREQGMRIGKDVHIFSDIISKEPYMISIGDDTTISGDVLFVTHDNSISKYLPEYTETFGEIIIGRNCFIGMRSIIMPGVTIADNTIVAAGACVTKSCLTSGNVLGGVPAKVIGTVEELKKKNEAYGFSIKGLTLEEKKELLGGNNERWVRR